MSLCITISSNDASADIVDDEGSFEFSPKAEFASPLQQAPKQQYGTLHNYYSIPKHLKLLAFKYLLRRFCSNFNFIGKTVPFLSVSIYTYIS